MTLQPLQQGGAATPLGRQVLAVELTDRLRQMIFDGVLLPGDKVPEKVLTERFAVSRTPLREAMKVLAAEGLIDLVPNRGAYVAIQTDAELVEVFTVLAMLECLAGELAAANATDAQIAAICELTTILAETFQRDDRPGYFQTNQKIHTEILLASGNETLRRAHALLACRIQRARYRANLTNERWAQAVQEHDRMARALSARDGATLGALMRSHMLNILQQTTKD